MNIQRTCTKTDILSGLERKLQNSVGNPEETAGLLRDKEIIEKASGEDYLQLVDDARKLKTFQSDRRIQGLAATCGGALLGAAGGATTAALASAGEILGVRITGALGFGVIGLTLGGVVGSAVANLITSSAANHQSDVRRQGVALMGALQKHGDVCT